jgi:hypothetical protein
MDAGEIRIKTGERRTRRSGKLPEKYADPVP